MALIIGRIVSGIAIATLGGYLITKHEKKPKNRSSKREQRPSQPMNFTIQVPDPKDNGNTIKVIGVGVLVSGLLTIYWWNKDKIVMSKLLQILKTQKSTKKEIKTTIHKAAQGINEKIDETDCKIQQVSHETQQINQNTNDIQFNVREMRDEASDHYYDVTQKLGRIEYQNNCLFSLAMHMEQQNRYNQPEIAFTPQIGWHPQRRSLMLLPSQNQNQNASQRGSRGVVTHRSMSLNESQIVLDESYRSRTQSQSEKKSKWLSKFGF